MPRYKLTIEYDGTPYAGWQRQRGAPSIQQTIEDAFSCFVASPVTLRVAGRTDTGVHALGQVAHVDLPQSWEGHRLTGALNAHLHDKSIVVLEAQHVSETFDARFSAAARIYEYRILNRPQPSALLHKRVWHIKRPLDVEAMRLGASCLIGHHDFTTFRATRCQAQSPMRTLERLEISKQGEQVVIRAVSRSFLHSQMRSIVGTLKLVGEARWQPQQVEAALKARTRTACGALAPPWALYLVAVDYAEHLGVNDKP